MFSHSHLLIALILALTDYMVLSSMAPHRMALINYNEIKQKKVDSKIISLHVTPTMINDADRVIVSYSLEDEPNYKDVFIASYSPSNVDITKTSPISYKFLNTTKGDTPFDLINMRSDYIFILFEGGLDAPVELARSNLVNFYNENAPRGARLMHTQNMNEMMLSWSSKYNTLHPHIIYWKCNDNNDKSTLYALSNTWSKSDFCGAPATTVGYRDPGFVHTVIMNNLIPGEQYCYQYGSDDELSAMKTFSQPSITYPFSVIAYGDEGQSMDDGTQLEEDMPFSLGTSKLALSLVQNDLTTKLVLHFGDISYARGYAADWDIFMNMNKDILSTVPYSVSVGNHEADYPNTSTYQNGTDSGGECGIAVQMQFPTPQLAINKPWYWFISGPIFIIMMSTEHDFRIDSEQYQYLEETLLYKINRQVTPWVIFTGHRPMYIDSTNNNTGSGDLTVANELQKYIEPLLMNAGGKPVDITLWGHHHSYQRMCASYGGLCKQRSIPKKELIQSNKNTQESIYYNPSYPIPIVVGTAGPSPSMNIQYPTPEYVETISFLHGVAHIKVFNESSFHWKFLNNIKGDVIDSFWLLK